VHPTNGNDLSPRTRPQQQLVFLAGTTKGGTSTLHLWLNQHPQIELSKRKELHYFCECPAPHLRAADNFGDYTKLFSENAPVTGESSPCYLFYPKTPTNIASQYPDALILISLRDPVERFWSHYLMNEIYRPTGMSPEAVLEACLTRGRTNAIEDILGVGLYRDQVDRYSDTFGRDRLKVIFLEDMESDPAGTVESVFKFLDLEPVPVNTAIRDKQYAEPRGPVGRMFLRTPQVRRIGVRLIPPPARRWLRTRILGVPSKPPMPPALRQRLQALYRDDCLALEESLGRALPWKWLRGDRTQRTP
jgi:hypothetical protein